MAHKQSIQRNNDSKLTLEGIIIPREDLGDFTHTIIEWEVI